MLRPAWAKAVAWVDARTAETVARTVSARVRFVGRIAAASLVIVLFVVAGTVFWRASPPAQTDAFGARPALAVLAIFSVMWRWNDFLLPLIVLSKNEFFTLQLALNSFQGELNTQWHYLLAMTVITLLPVTLVFAFLQRYITTGIAGAGVK